MIKVSRQRQLAFAPEVVQALLADPTNLPRMLDRITRVAVGAATPDFTPVTAFFDFGTPIGQRSAPGKFHASPTTVSFECATPLPILARWSLKPVPGATLVDALLRFDLKPLLGRKAIFAPTMLIKHSVGQELNKALARVEALLASTQ